ncbi:PREDICTED: uncharacterized protein LOC104747138 isoform X2 [Camelina sativa]|uniref:Uncharacterized protein LOC104747138 isoform X2 n=1 Tax=Camelina sativa TaxID=90675 RepID=A0ABM0W802_CAMSA|nr:PREDICTED: uncharacterized protein LOC104747138 isoform X2 [Camelina sativa]
MICFPSYFKRLLCLLIRMGFDSYVFLLFRELAIQIAEQFEALGADISLRCAVLVGGIDRMQQTIALGKRPHVIVRKLQRACLRNPVKIELPPNTPQSILLSSSIGLLLLNTRYLNYITKRSKQIIGRQSLIIVGESSRCKKVIRNEYERIRR